MVYCTYDLSLYYCYQLLPLFAHLLHIVFILGLLLAVLYPYHLLYQKWFRRPVTLILSQQGISIESASQSYSFTWQELIQIQLRQNLSQINRLSFVSKTAPYQQYFYLNSWMWPISLSQPQDDFFKFWNKLESLARQQQWLRVSNVSSHKKTQVDVISLIIDEQAQVAFQRKQRKIVSGLVFILLTSISLFIAQRLWHGLNQGNINLHNQGQAIAGTNFESFQNQVYIFKQGKGTFLLPRVKANQFTGLTLSHLPHRADELYSNVGKTPQHVYWQDYILNQLNPAKTHYLGNDYTKDHQSVYFQNKLLTGTNATHFSAVLHPTINALGYFYGKDSQQVYYKTHALIGLNPQQSEAFIESDQYIHDQHQVFYQNKKLKALDAQHTQIFIGNNRFSNDLNLATDGQSFYLNDRPLPHIAYYKFWGTTSVDLPHLQIVGIQSNEPYPGHFNYIFADQQRVYVYDEFYQRLQVLYQFTHPIQLKILSDRRFSDGQTVFSITEKLYRTRGRSSGTTTHGFKISLIQESDQQVLAQYFAPNPNTFNLSKFIHPIK